jgi:hypothetical protein
MAEGASFATLLFFAPCMQRPAVPRATFWLSLPWVIALLQTFTVVADSTPVRGLVSVAAFPVPRY